MNKVYKKYTFCILSLNMTGATIFLLFPTENLKFPWQWWLHIHWAVLAVNRLRTLPFPRPLLFLYASNFHVMNPYLRTTPLPKLLTFRVVLIYKKKGSSLVLYYQ